MRWETALSSEIRYKGSYLYLFSFHKKYPFLAGWSTSRRSEGTTVFRLSELLFLLLSILLKNALHVQQKHLKFITLWTSTKAPDLIQILSCCSSRHFSKFTCRYTNTLCSSTDNHLPLHPPRKASYWLTCTSRWLLIWARAGVMEVPSQAVQGRDLKE